jgi:hypothetical protein
MIDQGLPTKKISNSQGCRGSNSCVESINWDNLISGSPLSLLNRAPLVRQSRTVLEQGIARQTLGRSLTLALNDSHLRLSLVRFGLFQSFTAFSRGFLTCIGRGLLTGGASNPIMRIE